MARARTLHPGFFTDEKVVSVSIPARLLWQGLWCEADREGRLEDKPLVFKMRLFPVDSIDVAPLLDELAAVGLVERYQVDGRKLLVLPNFTRHQHVHPREAPSKLPPPPGHVTPQPPEPARDAGQTKRQKPGLSSQPSTVGPEKAVASREKDIASPSVPQAFKPSSLQDLHALRPSSPSGDPPAKVRRLVQHVIVAAPDGGQEIDLASPEVVAQRADAWLDRAQALRAGLGHTDAPGNKARAWCAYFFAKYQPEDAGAGLLEAFKDFLHWCIDTSKHPGWGLWLRDEVWGPRWDTVRVGGHLGPAQGRSEALFGAVAQ